MSSMTLIHDFLGQKRLAMVGVSRDPGNFSRKLFHELRERGYDLVPVNPEAGIIEGKPGFAHVQDVEPPVDGALLMTSPAVTVGIVRDCAAAGIKRVWMYRAAGHGAVDPSAVKFCEHHDITVIAGECPFMFLPDAGWIHGFHGFVRKITGRLPH